VADEETSLTRGPEKPSHYDSTGDSGQDCCLGAKWGNRIAVHGRRRVAVPVVLTLAVGSWNSLALIIVGPVVGEIGFMLGSVALTIMATSSLGDQHAGLAAGLVNTSNQLGGGFGLGIVAAVVGATASQAGIDATALTFGFLTCLAFVLAAFLVVVIASGDQPERLERVPSLDVERRDTQRRLS
jgi:hypothetical protein